MEGERSWQVDADELAGSMLTWMDSLRGKGFNLRPSDYAEALAVLDRLKPGDTESLMYYLAPIICKNQEEQDRFYQLFRDDLLSGRKLQIGNGATIIAKHWKKRWRTIALIAAAILLILAGVWLLSPRPAVPSFAAPVIGMSGSAVIDKPVQFYYVHDPRDTSKPDWFVKNDDEVMDIEGRVAVRTDTFTYTFNQLNNF